MPGSWILDDFSLLDLASPNLYAPRPLSYLSFWLNWRAFGDSPLAFKLTNIAIHAAAVQMSYLALRRLIGAGASFWAAAIFACHPLQGESVLYVFARPQLLMGLFSWVAIERWLGGKHWISTVYFLLALASKEEAVALPIFLSALHLSISRNRREGRPLAAMFVVAALAIAGTVWITGKTAGSGAGTQAGIAPITYFASQTKVVGVYLLSFLNPLGFGLPIFDWHPVALKAWAAAFWTLPVIALIAFRGRLSRAQWVFWILAAFLFLIPTSTIFPLADLAAFRRMYLPVACLAVTLVLTARRWMPAFLVACLFVSTYRNYRYWRDPAAFWEQSMNASHRSLRPALQYTRYVGPEQALATLTDYEPEGRNDDGYQMELGRVYLELNQPPLALRAFGKALALDPGKASNVYNRGVALLALQQIDAARMDFERALQINPSFKPAREALSRLTPAR